MKKKASAKKHAKQFVLITGMSGSGKASVLKSFEDLGYHCVDNLPFDLILKFAEMCQQPGSRIDRAAAVVDIRGGEALSQLPTHYRDLARNKLLRPSLVFLEASDKALIRRFEETRRPHPLGRDLPVREGIRLERMLLKPMRQLANVVIDTTRLKRSRTARPDSNPLRRHRGTPLDADFRGLVRLPLRRPDGCRPGV